jgi:hypothetical protein
MDYQGNRPEPKTSKPPKKIKPRKTEDEMSEHVGYVYEGRYGYSTRLNNNIEINGDVQRLYTEEQMREVATALDYILSHVGGHLGREEKWVFDKCKKYREVLE